MKADIEQIVWPEGYSDNAEMLKKTEIVKMLCLMGEVVMWTGGGPPVRMPYQYKIGGVTVEFLPHWDFYTVAGIRLHIPTSADAVRAAVLAVATLHRLGYEDN